MIVFEELAKVLKCLDDGQPHTARAISTACDLSREEVERHLHSAQTSELVTWDRGDMWELTEQGKAAIMPDVTGVPPID